MHAEGTDKVAQKPSPVLVKLSRPRLFDAVPRPRLYATLDQLLQHPLAWICGPPGAGKTTLVAGYLESRKLPCIWYQMDAGDIDPATFFHYLAVAAADHGRGPARLPAFEPQVLLDLRGYSRRFFRELFSRLRAQAVLVFDNFEEASAAPALVEILRAASDEIPHRSNLIVISRTDPPAAFARPALNQIMATLDPAALRLSEEEVRHLAHRAGLDDDKAILAVSAQTDGWAAGVRLLVERMRGGVPAAAPAVTDSQQALFDYFAEQVFARAPPGVEAALARLAMLPRVTADIARRVSRYDDCDKLLDHLARRHLFVERRASATRPSDGYLYQFHTLFRTFLRDHARRTLGSDGLRMLALESARALETAGCVEDAIGLFLEAQAWQDATRLMHGTVPQLLSEARFGVAQHWLAQLPDTILDADADLLYWSGGALAGQDPARARGLLEAAHALAQARGDRRLSVCCAAGIIETLFLEHSRFAPLDEWIGALETQLATPLPWAGPAEELHVRSAQFSAMLYRSGDSEALGAIAARMLALLHEDVDADLKLGAGAWLLSYGGNLGKLDFAANVLPLVEPLLARSDLSPLRRGLCAYFVAWCALMSVDRTASDAALGQLQRMAQGFPVPLLERFALITAAWMETVFHPRTDSSRIIRQFERVMDTSHPYDVAALHSMRALHALSKGDANEGLHAARAAVQAYELVGAPWQRLVARGLALWASVEIGDATACDSLIGQMQRIAQASRVHVYDALVHQARAWLALQAQADEALIGQRLRELFDQARVYGTSVPTRFIPAWMPRLAAEALARGIDTTYVRRLILAYRWPPPRPELGEWPFQVRVRMLGGFEIEIGDVPLVFGGKAPRKTLGLLKALICMGGRDVRDYQLIDALWPDEEADAARSVFGVTLHRLRRLLGAAETIEVVDGCVSLNPDQVWVDALAFERLIGNNGGPDEHSGARALALYRGPLLPGDADAAWSAPLRERLRTKFVLQVGRQGRVLEQQQRWDETIVLYMHGLDADSLNEAFYRGLMRVHQAAGDRSQALRLYGRLQETLSASLGIAPARETQALYEQCLRGEPGAGDLPARPAA